MTHRLLAAAAAAVAALLLPGIAAAQVRMNDIQAVGTHNSYKVAIPPNELAIIRARTAEGADALDYGHAALEAQLDAGARTIELDVWQDPQGGLYATPLLPRVARSPLPPVDTRPGYKVMHMADVDVRAHCVRFVDCLAILKRWSSAHPGHVPILIMINAKDETAAVPGAVKVPHYTTAAFDALDAEIRSVFGAGDLVTPDLVRGRHKTLREAVAAGWPMLDAVRGRFFFALDEGPEKVDLYRGGRRNLEGRVMFVNGSETADDAAYLTLNDPVGDAARIRSALAHGLIVRTRADADTIEARAGDTRRRDAAFASGAHYVSTDYMAGDADARFPGYSVGLPGGEAARCNPVHRDGCRTGRLEPESRRRGS
ncbi:phosphatidylinositol-specific phospholipase C1-like protein [Sphingomonas sp. KR3-1]|uniref:phosphatidylinositol-specific phospholipase C1-like protein n=1 Tax=Sphingomonas sp. KR3-1 TaxID=3156611 RepID=UPI0032B54265